MKEFGERIAYYQNSFRLNRPELIRRRQTTQLLLTADEPIVTDTLSHLVTFFEARDRQGQAGDIQEATLAQQQVIGEARALATLWRESTPQERRRLSRIVQRTNRIRVAYDTDNNSRPDAATANVIHDVFIARKARQRDSHTRTFTAAVR